MRLRLGSRPGTPIIKGAETQQIKSKVEKKATGQLETANSGKDIDIVRKASELKAITKNSPRRMNNSSQNSKSKPLKQGIQTPQGNKNAKPKLKTRQPNPILGVDEPSQWAVSKHKT